MRIIDVTKCSRTAIWAPALKDQLDNITNSSSEACKNTTIVQAQIEARPMNITTDDTAESLQDDYANSSQHSSRRSYLTDKKTKKLKWKEEICSRLARKHFSICHNSYFLSNRMSSDILLINQRLSGCRKVRSVSNSFINNPDRFILLYLYHVFNYRVHVTCYRTLCTCTHSFQRYEFNKIWRELLLYSFVKYCSIILLSDQTHWLKRTI